MERIYRVGVEIHFEELRRKLRVAFDLGVISAEIANLVNT